MLEGVVDGSTATRVKELKPNNSIKIKDIILGMACTPLILFICLCVFIPKITTKNENTK